MKADGYGHGAVPVARAALEGGAGWLAVALVDEGIELRQAGIDRPGPAPLRAAGRRRRRRGGPRPHPDGGRPRAAGAAGRGGPPAAGAARGAREGRHRHAPGGGVAPEGAAGAVGGGGRRAGPLGRGAVDPPGGGRRRVRGRPGLHRAPAAPVRPRWPRRSPPRARGPLVLHAANSAGAISFPAARYDLVRCGIALYGVAPSPAVAADLAAAGRGRCARPCRCARRSWPCAGSRPASAPPTAGSARCPARSVVATVPLGYADGVPRALFEAGLLGADRRPPPPAGRHGHHGPDRGRLRPRRRRGAGRRGDAPRAPGRRRDHRRTEWAGGSSAPSPTRCCPASAPGCPGRCPGPRPTRGAAPGGRGRAGDRRRGGRAVRRRWPVAAAVGAGVAAAAGRGGAGHGPTAGGEPTPPSSRRPGAPCPPTSSTTSWRSTTGARSTPSSGAGAADRPGARGDPGRGRLGAPAPRPGRRRPPGDRRRPARPRPVTGRGGRLLAGAAGRRPGRGPRGPGRDRCRPGRPLDGRDGRPAAGPAPRPRTWAAGWPGLVLVATSSGPLMPRPGSAGWPGPSPVGADRGLRARRAARARHLPYDDLGPAGRPALLRRRPVRGRPRAHPGDDGRHVTDRRLGAPAPASCAFDVRARIGAIDLPTWVVVGSRDVLTPPRMARAMAAAIPGPRLVVLRGCGHMVMLERRRRARPARGEGVGRGGPGAVRGRGPPGTMPRWACSRPPGAFEALRTEALGCTRCRLAEGRTQVVFGVGDPTRRPHVRRRGARTRGGPGRRAVRRPLGQAARPAARRGAGHRPQPLLHRQRGQVPPAAEPRPAARRDRGLPPLPRSASSS